MKDISTIPSSTPPAAPPPRPSRPLFPPPQHSSSTSCCVLQYYEDEGDSEMSGAHPDEEVAVTKRGRAVKLPAKYKAEVSSPPPPPPPPPLLSSPAPLHTLEETKAPANPCTGADKDLL